MKTTKRNISLDKLEKVARLLKTISHPVRLEILEALEEYKTLDVSTIGENIETVVEQSMLSHHLIKMRDNGVLKSKKEGKHIFYSIAEPEILKIFDCMQNCNLG
ncbi:ArsR/SmtB family transcription factor [Luteibaculum oceani]|uniref:Helix-turn-helix transcriptional regulator n=1 Tax=Luteibaculum oceani TaxID=1294296 RepID=A0A5C6UUH5_9FLAO|nr:metalloregulator ArsR/SmtB family transcription factor [Luteibaculum oceani]TXC76254.1 helix-turn-helix transcriptional regulator [Luteibaculum oceani]